jgi:hypothetical protein
VSKLIIALVAGTSALFATGAIAAPLNPTTTGVDNGVEKVRMVCDQAGRCWRERGPRRVIIQRDSYGYDRGRRHHRHHHHHDRGPSVGIHAPGVSIGIGDGGRRW